MCEKLTIFSALTKTDGLGYHREPGNYIPKLKYPGTLFQNSIGHIEVKLLIDLEFFTELGNLLKKLAAAYENDLIPDLELILFK